MSVNEHSLVEALKGIKKGLKEIKQLKIRTELQPIRCIRKTELHFSHPFADIIYMGIPVFQTEGLGLSFFSVGLKPTAIM